MIKSHMVQKVSITPAAKELEKWLDIIQTKWHYKVLNVFETEGYNIPNGSKQGFVILYDDGKPIVGEGGERDGKSIEV